MGIFNIYETVKKAIQDVVAPEIQGLKGEIRTLQAEIKRLDDKVTSEVKRLDEKIESKHHEVLLEIKRLDEKMTSGFKHLDDKVTSEIRRLDEKSDSKHNEVLSEIRRLDGKIDALDGKLEFVIKFHERLARVEAKLGLGQGS